MQHFCFCIFLSELCKEQDVCDSVCPKLPFIAPKYSWIYLIILLQVFCMGMQNTGTEQHAIYGNNLKKKHKKNRIYPSSIKSKEYTGV